MQQNQNRKRTSQRCETQNTQQVTDSLSEDSGENSDDSPLAEQKVEEWAAKLQSTKNVKVVGLDSLKPKKPIPQEGSS